MIQKIDHVALAVRSIEEVATFFEEVFGAKLDPDYIGEVPGVLSRRVIAGQSVFELLESSVKGGPIEQFLDRRGEGVHHVKVQVDNQEELLRLCEARGMTIINRRFIHPKSAHGVLIELGSSTEG